MVAGGGQPGGEPGVGRLALGRPERAARPVGAEHLGRRDEVAGGRDAVERRAGADPHRPPQAEPRQLLEHDGRARAAQPGACTVSGSPSGAVPV